MKIIKLMVFVLLLIFVDVVNLYAVTYYVDGAVSNDGGNGSLSTPKKYIQSGIALMSSGDTLIIADGTYTGAANSLNYNHTVIPSGNSGNYTKIQAKNNHGVTIEYNARPLDIRGKSYVQIEGIRFNGLLGSETGYIGSCDHIKVLRCAFYGANEGSGGNVSCIATGSSSYILLEECWAWGGGRYKFHTQSSQYVIYRRCVARYDYMNHIQCANFVRYDSNNIHFQNCIAIDNAVDAVSGQYGGFWNERNSNVDTTGSNKGCIVLNVTSAAFNDYKVEGTRTYENCVVWGTTNAFHLGFWDNLTGTININHCTVGGTTGNGNYGNGDAYYWEIDAGTTNVTNSIAVNNGRYGFEKDESGTWTGLNYNALYGNTVGNYDNATAGTHDITNVNIRSASLLYLPRIETGSALDGAGSDGGDIGATVLKQHGTAETLYGEAGWDTLTNVDLWPWPNEDHIKSDMATYNANGVSGARGFCAATANPRTDTGYITLTSYIWEYLGNPIPAEIYGGTQNNSPIASLSADKTSGVAPLAVVFSGTGTDSDGTISSYAWNFGDSQTSSQQNPSHTYNSAGSYTVTLTVTDNNGATGTASTTITVTAAGVNNPPTANAGVNINSGTSPLTVSFTGAGVDSDGTIASYLWNFGDSSSSNLQNPTHIFASAGSYTAILTVTDDDGATGTASVIITATSGTEHIFYVSPGGSDSALGTQSQPWLTLQHASDVAVAGDTVLVNDGTYAGFCNWDNSGTSALPITYRANGANVIINSRNSSTIDNINIENVNYIVIDGFKVQNSPRAGIRVVNSMGTVVKNTTCSNNTKWGIFTGFAPSVQILNNFCSGSAQEHGIYVSNSNVPNDAPIIRGNTCYGNYQNGIQLNGDLYSGGDGTISAGLIEKNIVHDNGWKGFSLISVQDSTIRNNIIYNNGTRNAGAGGIHLADEPGTSVYSSNNLVVNNTIIEPRIAGIRMGSGSANNTVFNNIVVSSSQIVDEDGGNYIDTTSNAKSSSTSGLFVNPTINDYHLSNSSIAKDLGKSSYNSKNAPTQDFDDNSRPQGSYYDSGAYESTVVVATDTTAPSAVSNLTITGTTASTASLRWTAPGDDAGVGTAASYDVRRSTATITTSNWASATAVSGEPTPSAAGTVQTMTVSGLTASTTYYFAMKVLDEVPNISGLSNVVSAATATPPDTTAPYTTGHNPANLAVDVVPGTNIVVHVMDDGAGVDINTIVMRVNGQVVAPVITGTPADYTLTYDPSSDFSAGETVTVSVDASDLAP